MSGSKQGGYKAARSNKASYGEDFYKRIGKLGGKKGTTGGFYANHELAKTAGAKGGSISKRGPWTDEQRAKALATRRRNKGLPAERPKHKIWDIVRSITHA